MLLLLSLLLIVEVDEVVKMKSLFYFRRVGRDLGISQSASRIRITKQITSRESDLDSQRGLEDADEEEPGSRS